MSKGKISFWQFLLNWFKSKPEFQRGPWPSPGNKIADGEAILRKPYRDEQEAESLEKNQPAGTLSDEKLKMLTEINRANSTNNMGRTIPFPKSTNVRSDIGQARKREDEEYEERRRRERDEVQSNPASFNWDTINSVSSFSNDSDSSSSSSDYSSNDSSSDYSGGGGDFGGGGAGDDY